LFSQETKLFFALTALRQIGLCPCYYEKRPPGYCPERLQFTINNKLRTAGKLYK
jgi:hypothetical protein